MSCMTVFSNFSDSFEVLAPHTNFQHRGGIPNYFFLENEIEVDQLHQLLNDNHLDILVPQIGKRMRLKNAIIKYLSTQPLDIENIEIIGDLTQTDDPNFVKIIATELTHSESESGVSHSDSVLSDYIQSVTPTTSTASGSTAVSGLKRKLGQVKEVYFTAPVKKRQSRDNKSEAAKGKLIDKYRNKLTFLRRAHILPGRLKDAEKEDDTSLINTEPFDENDRNSFLWLKNNYEPWSEVVSHWKNSFRQRNKYYDENISLEDIYGCFPALRQPAGFDLIDKDFEVLFKDKINLLYNKFDKTIENLIVLRKSNLNDTDKLLLDIYQNTENLNDDYKHVLGLSLLVSLIPCRNRYNLKKKDKEQWKPTLAESREGILIRVDVPGDVQNAIDIKHKKMKDLDLSVQPFIIVEGNASVVNKIYVVINRTIYVVPTLLRALDIIFKAFHVFKLRYPVECEHIWMFIQLSIYNIKTKWDNNIPNVIDLVNKVQKL
ncbi:hypothetical protein FQR65_LT05651 [Abscondita terminalis]|nr:hypothetical protein FQR65_LT05651 [Abscondita terminalis]